jgi:competence protein ComEC
VFDTGVKTSDDFDMGKVVILPYLLAKGIKKIDVMVISHGDNDHIGGAKSILEELPVAKVMTSVPKRFKPEAAFCKEGLQWHWDGVAFKFLSPPTGLSLRGNDMSCVLKVTAKSKGILLTGDIEQKAEHLLIKVHDKELRSNILVVPHHGSKTSSSSDFLNAVTPSYAIFSYGYLNRYHHPHGLVIKRYLARKITVFDTVHSGAITMTFAPDSAIVAIQEFRKKYHKFWYQD